jgi:hypothetical protein
MVFRCTVDGLVFVSDVVRDDPEAPIRPEEFAIRAEAAARQTTRELGWIV